MSGDSLRGMCCDKTEVMLSDFMRYLEKRNLSICNFTKVGAIFWPVDGYTVVEGFIKDQMKK